MIKKVIIILLFFIIITSKKIKDSNNNCILCRQSPINIIPTNYIINKNNIINFLYKGRDIIASKNYISQNKNYQFNVIKPNNYKLIFNNNTYNLIQYHFHKPSEHKLLSNIFDMEIHFVHKNPNKNHYIVVAFFISFEKGSSPLFDDAIKLSDKPKINLNNILNNKFYHYNGSLTTDPFTTNVSWIVFNDIVKTNFTPKFVNQLWNNKAKARKINDHCNTELLTFDR